MGKKKRIIISAAGFLLVIGIAAGGDTGNYFYNLALNPDADRSSVLNASHNQVKRSDENKAEWKAQLKEWNKTIEYERMEITSNDGLNLNAHVIYQEQPADKWVVIAHGYGMRGLSMAGYARFFYEAGYNVLLPDARGHGDSDGDYIGMGWHDRLDMVNWIKEVVRRNPQSEIVLYGVSMGASTVMMTAGEDLPVNVKAAVEDCGYSSVSEEFEYQLEQLYHIPSFPVLNFASAVTKVRAGYTFGEADAVKQLKKTEIPMLFIHGDQDTFVPSEMLEEVYEAAASEKEKYVVEGAGHSMAAIVAGDEYQERVLRFVDKYLE